MKKLSLPVLLISSLLISGCGGGGGGNTSTGTDSGTNLGLNAPGLYAGTGIRSPRPKKVIITDRHGHSWTVTNTYGGVSGHFIIKHEVIGSPDEDEDGISDNDQVVTVTYTAGGLTDEITSVSSDGEVAVIKYNYGGVIFSPTLNPVVATMTATSDGGTNVFEHTYHLVNDNNLGDVATKLIKAENSFGFITEYEYNSEGYLKTVIVKNPSEPNNLHKTHYTYNSSNKLVLVENLPVTTQFGIEVGDKKEFFYNDSGLLSSAREYEWETTNNPNNYSWVLILEETYEFEDGNYYYHQPPDAFSVLGNGGY